MDSPDSDFASNGTYSIPPSEPSTPGTPLEPFAPRFKVKVTDPVKDGEVIVYTVKTTSLEGSGKDYSVKREYDDFEWLHHLILTQNSIMGVIVPPLPLRPVVDAKKAENKSKKTLGTDSKILMGDDFDKDCKSLEKYLRLLLAHWAFGNDSNLTKFLTVKEAPMKTKVKKGLFEKLSSAMESRKASHRDVDDYFQKERDKANEYAKIVTETSNNFNKMVNSNQRISCAYGHLSTALNLSAGSHNDENNTKTARLLIKFSEVLDDAKHGIDVDVINDENTLGFQLDLASRYTEAVKEMLYNRTCLMVEYEDANKAYQKAKPQKRQEAEDAKKAAEKTFEDCNEVARRELQSHSRQRLLLYSEALATFADAKVKTARDTYALLAKSLSALKQMED